MKFSLRKRILLLVAGCIVALVSVLMYFMTSAAAKQIQGAVQSKVKSAANMLSQVLESRASTLADECRDLAKQPMPPARASLLEVTKYARSAAGAIRADALMVTDASGQLLGDSSYLRAKDKTVQPKKRDYADHPAVRTALTGKVWQGVLVRGDKLFLAVGVPVRSGGAIRASLTAFVRLDTDLAKRMKDAILTEVVFVHQGKEVAGTVPFFLKGLDKASTVKEIHTSRRSYYTGYVPLPGTTMADGMGILALDEQDGAMGPYKSLAFTMALSGAGALFVALLLGLWVGRSFSGPIERVIEAAKQIKKGDWPHPFKIHRLDEVGRLQNAFNEMTLSLKKSQDRLLAMLDADPLTGLENHRKFQERLEEEVTRTTFTEQPLSLVLIDLDRFQEYNLRHGHAEGDAALTTTSRLVKSASPEGAILARFGGEEFAILLPNTVLDDAEKLGEEVRRAIEKAFGKTGANTGMTVSVGCAQLIDNRQYKGFVLTAELAVTRAKHLGRNRVCRFDTLPGADSESDPYQLHRFLQDGSFATIQALAAAVDAKDPYTQGHSQRVAEYASELAKYVGLPDETVKLVQTSGTLHDVGKVGVPDEVLKKPGKLTDEERAIMETHPVLGEHIVKKAPHLSDTLPGIRSHHERWDGKGYPDGLAGEDIPLLGRILAVADVFDAMTSDRPYRKGMHFWEAIWEIERMSGTQFDPKFALAFVDMMRNRSDWTFNSTTNAGRRRSRTTDWKGPERRQASA